MYNFTISYEGLKDKHTEVAVRSSDIYGGIEKEILHDEENLEFTDSSSSSSSSSPSLSSEFEERTNYFMRPDSNHHQEYDRELILREFERESSGDFAALDDEIVLNIFSFLKPDDILNAGQTCRRLNKLSKDPVLWKEVSNKTPWKTNVFGSYSFYSERLKSYKYTKMKERERIIDKSIDSVGKMLGDTLIYLCNYLTERICIYCFLLQTIFFVMKLDHDIDWKWPCVFIPSYIIFVLFIPISFLSMIFSFVSGRYAILHFYDDHMFSPLIFVTMLGYYIIKHNNSHKCAKLVSTGLFFSHFMLFVFTLLMILKLDGTISMSWSVIFIFVYPFLLIQTLVVIPAINKDNMGILIIMAVGGFTTFITLLLFGFYLDETIICSAQMVFVPAYVIAAVSFFVVYFIDISDDDDTEIMLGIFTSIVCVFVVSFVGPLGKTLDGFNDKKFATSYIGIFLLEALLMLGHLLLSFVSCLFHIEDED